MKLLRSWILMLLCLALALATGPTPIAQAAPGIFNPKLSADQNTNPIVLLSPDGDRVVYTANLGPAARLYSAPTNGSAAPVPLNELQPAAHSVTQFAISPDSSRVVFLFQDPLNGQQELYSVPIGGGSQSRLNPNLQAFASVSNFQISPDGSQVVFRADLSTDEEFRLYSVSLLGGAVNGLSKQPVAGGSVAVDFAFNPDGSQVVYRGDLDTDGVIELYRSQIGSFGSTRLNTPLAMGKQVFNFKIAPNGTEVVYLANQDHLLHNELFQASLQPGGAPVTKLNQLLLGDGNVTTYQISPDSAHVVYRADVGLTDHHHLYLVALGGGQSRRLNGDFAGSVSSIFRISPNSSWAVYLSDEQTSGTIELYAASLTHNARIKLNGNLAAGGNVSLFAISPDSQRVVYRADQDTAGTFELYSSRIVDVGTPAAQVEAEASTSANSSRIKLSGPMSGGLIGFQISPAGDRVIYLADQTTPGVNELFNVPIGGGSEPVRVHAPLDGGRDVAGGIFTADGSRVIYRASQDNAAIFSIYAAFDVPPMVTLAGPAGPLEPGEYELTVRLSNPTVLRGVTVRLARGGDAVAGKSTGDYLLSSIVVGVKSEGSALSAANDEMLITLAPGQAEWTLHLQVFDNPERVAPRLLSVSVVPSPGISVGELGALGLFLAGNETRLYLPLLMR